MFNFMTICESIKRHWVAVALIGILSVCLGAGVSFVKGGAEGDGSTYTAEAVLYATGYGYDEEAREGSDYNYSYSEAYMMTDLRRLVVSGDVAGKVREEFGDDVELSSPYWFDRETEQQNYDRFVYVDASAPDAETAIEAANRAAALTLEKAKEIIPVSEITLSEEAVLKTGDLKRAADWGIDKIENPNAPEPSGAGISLKVVVVFLFVGLFVSVFGFAAYDILSRKVRSERDIERLIEVPVIADFSNEADRKALADNLRVLMHRNNFSSLCLASPSANDALEEVAKNVLQSGFISKGTVVLSESSDAASQLSQTDSIVLVVKEAAAKGAEIDHALKCLAVSGTPVLGAVFIPRKMF